MNEGDSEAQEPLLGEGNDGSKSSGIFPSLTISQRLFGETSEVEPILGGGGSGSGLENTGIFPTLTLSQRLSGCAVCLAIGMFLSIGALGRTVELIRGHPAPFVVYFTLGLMVNLAASFFLSGPAEQAKQMADPKRRKASLFLVCGMVSTLVLASLPTHGGFLSFLQGTALVALLVTMTLAQGYYVLTFVPGGVGMLTTAAKAQWALAREGGF